MTCWTKSEMIKHEHQRVVIKRWGFLGEIRSLARSPSLFLSLETPLPPALPAVRCWHTGGRHESSSYYRRVEENGHASSSFSLLIISIMFDARCLNRAQTSQSLFEKKINRKNTSRPCERFLSTWALLRAALVTQRRSLSGAGENNNSIWLIKIRVCLLLPTERTLT